MNARPSALQLQWRKCPLDRWCRFESAVLPDAAASGIVVVWSGSRENVVYLGQGGIAKNLKWARQFAPIAGRQDLFVTWASVTEDSQPGVWNYLSARLSPLHHDRPTSDIPIPVNLPWEVA